MTTKNKRPSAGREGYTQTCVPEPATDGLPLPTEGSTLAPPYTPKP